MQASASAGLSLSSPAAPEKPLEAPASQGPSPGSVLQEAAITEDTCYPLPGNKMLPAHGNPPLTLHGTEPSRGEEAARTKETRREGERRNAK